MIRRFVLLCLCGALVLMASPGPAGAQDAEQPAQELWDEFPLEPTATPAAAVPTATATPEVVEDEPSGGIGTGTLIALVVAAGAVGGFAARAASRRLPAKRAETATPVAPAAAAPPAPQEVRLAPVPAPLDPAPADPEPEPEPEPAEPEIGAEADKTAPPPPPPTRARRRARVIAPEDKPEPARRFAPTRSTPATDVESCTITLTNRADRGRFVALDASGGVVARSPIFPLNAREAESPEGFSPPDALDDLVGELAAAGWRQTAKGPRPWDMRFQRRVEATRPAGR